MDRQMGPVRHGHPETSYYAAADVGPTIPTVRARVLEILKDHPDGLTHDDLMKLYWARGWPAADGSIRTRCKELVTDGEVERVPDRLGKSKFGRPSILWRVVPEPKTDQPWDGALW